ncbi:hypothetical protein LDENG_00132220 [Lucifuga dentata]|nr:hypothetical protein LDENG_00132220 [Lucifuga dentata]
MVIHAFISSRLDYCNSLFTFLNKTSLNWLQTSLRSLGQKLMVIPRTRLKTRGDCAFQAPKLWNVLPSTVCSVDSEVVFRRQIKRCVERLFGSHFLL